MSLSSAPPASPEQWPQAVVSLAAARVDALRDWWTARPALRPADSAARTAATLMLRELDVLVSHLRVTTTHALVQLDEVSATLAAVNAALSEDR